MAVGDIVCVCVLNCDSVDVVLRIAVGARLPVVVSEAVTVELDVAVSLAVADSVIVRVELCD